MTVVVTVTVSQVAKAKLTLHLLDQKIEAVVVTYPIASKAKREITGAMVMS